MPFVLTEDFMRVIAKGSDNPAKQEGFKQYDSIFVHVVFSFLFFFHGEVEGVGGYSDVRDKMLHS